MIEVKAGCLLSLMFIHALLSRCVCCYPKLCCTNRYTTTTNILHAGYGGEHSLARCPPPQAAESQPIFLQVNFCTSLQWGKLESSWFVEKGHAGRSGVLWLETETEDLKGLCTAVVG